MKEPVGTRCNAKNRAGEQCKKWAINGKTKCKNHGGKSIGAPKENQYTVKHGIYSKFYSDEEMKILDDNDLAIQSVRDEIKLTRIQLYRAIKKQYEIDDSLTIQQVVDNFGEMVEKGIAVEKSEVRGKTDHHSIIDRYLGRLQSLLKTERELSQANNNTDLAFEQVYIKTDEQGPDNPIY